jgi:hypothetical protein
MAATRVVPLLPVTRPLHLIPPFELDSVGDEDDDDASREARHLAMDHQNSLTTVVTDVWEKAKRARDIADKEEQNMCKAKCASIRSERFIIIDYSDDEYDLSDKDSEEEELIAAVGRRPKS